MCKLHKQNLIMEHENCPTYTHPKGLTRRRTHFSDVVPNKHAHYLNYRYCTNETNNLTALMVIRT